MDKNPVKPDIHTPTQPPQLPVLKPKPKPTNMTTKPNTTTTPAPTQNQTLPKTGVDGSATVKGMQTTLDFWKNKCKDKDEGSPTSTKVPKGRKPTQNSKGRAMTTTRRKCKSDNFSQIQGQSKILSFLEHKKIQ